MLADVQRVRPGLVRHRGLVVGRRPHAFARALRETFDECDTLSESLRGGPGIARRDRGHTSAPSLRSELRIELPFADETFDFVYRELPPDAPDGDDTERVVAETIRVLRLHGVAAVELSGSRRGGAERGAVADGAGELDVRLSGIAGMSRLAGACCDIAVTVTNTGGRVLGSVVDRLTLESAWKPARRGVHPEFSELGGALLPGEALTRTMSIAVPREPGTHTLELSVVRRGSWEERRSPRMLLAVDVPHAAPGAERFAVVRLPQDEDAPVALALARANGALLEARDVETEPARRRYLIARA